MADRLTAEQRHRNMVAIKGRDTTPELIVRKLLHKLGYRFRLHVRNLPGTPDIVLPRYHTVIMVHGCFWHLHGCRYTKIPQTRRGFWIKKLEGNKSRDKRHEKELRAAGWNVIVVWECEVRFTDLLINRLSLLMPKK